VTIQRFSPGFWLILGIMLATLLLLWAGLFGVDAHATVNVVPPPAVKEDVIKEKEDKNDGPIGAYIELRGGGGAWGVVQWQDSAGNWHDVEGWRGSLLAGGQSWWVDRKDFGAGPFRWVVSESAAGPVLGASQPFSLPSGANQVMVITVSPGTSAK
jgi:hypothetical protein